MAENVPISRKLRSRIEAVLAPCPVCRGSMLLIQSDGNDCRISRECPHGFYLRCRGCSLLYGYEPDRGGMYRSGSLSEMARHWNEGTARPVRIIPRPISLAAARVNAGLTQREVAKALGVSASYLCSMEHGHYPMKAQDFKKLARLFGVQLCEIQAPRLVEGKEEDK